MMNINDLNLPDELFDNTSEQENYPEKANETQTGAQTDLDDTFIGTTDDADDDLAKVDE
jgi:hypothetical protein